MVYVYTQETTTTQIYDRLEVKIRDLNGNTLITPDVYSNLTSTPNGIYITISHDVSTLAGRTVQVYFYATTDSTLNTWFWIDDVSLMVN